MTQHGNDYKNSLKSLTRSLMDAATAPLFSIVSPVEKLAFIESVLVEYLPADSTNPLHPSESTYLVEVDFTTGERMILMAMPESGCMSSLDLLEKLQHDGVNIDDVSFGIAVLRQTGLVVRTMVEGRVVYHLTKLGRQISEILVQPE